MNDHFLADPSLTTGFAFIGLMAKRAEKAEREKAFKREDF